MNTFILSHLRYIVNTLNLNFLFSPYVFIPNYQEGVLIIKNMTLDKELLINEILGASLPYGVWHTRPNTLILFNRFYEPIRAYDLTHKTHIPILPNAYIPNIVLNRTLYFYDATTSLHHLVTIQRCYDILKQWDHIEDGIGTRDDFKFLLDGSLAAFTDSKTTPLDQQANDLLFINTAENPSIKINLS